MTQSEAVAAIAAAGLTVGTVTEQYHASIPAGRVISQTPAAGAAATASQPVNLVMSLGPAAAVVPNVVGMTQAAAQAAITAAGLAVGTVTQQYHISVPAGNVISQNPAGGAGAALNQAVALVVSKGPAPVLVPNVVGMAQGSAQSAITSVGLIVGTVTLQNHGSIAAGYVISQNPAGGANAALGQSVNLVVSSGPGTVTAPNVVGMTQAAAQAAITAAGLTVGTVTQQYHISVPIGNVISQNPAGGVILGTGQSVDLVVSSGAAPVAVPNVIGLTQQAAETAIEGAGFVLGTVTGAPDPTAPEGQVIGQEPQAGQLVAAGTIVDLVVSLGADVLESIAREIGAQGGSLALDDGTGVVVPPGALAAPVWVTVQKLDIAPDGTEPASCLYAVSGLPEWLAEPVEISLKLGVAAEDETFVVWEEPGLRFSGNDSGSARSLLPATMQDGCALAVLDLPEQPGKLAAPKAGAEPIYIHAVTGYMTMVSRNGSFATRFSIAEVGDNFAARVGKFNDDLEDAYSLLTGTVGVTCRERSQPVSGWPIQVHLFEFNNTWAGGSRSETAWGYGEASKRGRNYDMISLNSRMLSQPDADRQFRATCGHELFHVFQLNYVGPYYVATDTAGWIREATSTWFEFLMMDATFWPAVIDANNAALFPLNGLMNYAGSAAGSSDRHGYGASLFIRYLADKYGNAFVGRLWEALGAGHDQIIAFSEATDDPQWHWQWTPFAVELYSNKLTPDNLMSNARQGTWTVDDLAPGTFNRKFTRRFQRQLPALSATLYVIQLASQSSDYAAGEEGVLKIDATGLETLAEFNVLKLALSGVTELGKLDNAGPNFCLNGLAVESPATLMLLATSEKKYAPTTAEVKADCAVTVAEGCDRCDGLELDFCELVRRLNGMIYYELNALRHGPYRTGMLPYTDGNERGCYSQGLKHGLWTSYVNGAVLYRISEGRYLEGKKQGVWQTWPGDGSTLLSSEGEFDAGKREGVWRWWHSNGQLYVQCSFVNDVWHGPYQEWWGNGNLHYEGQYTNGVRTGTWTSCSYDGDCQTTEYGK